MYTKNKEFFYPFHTKVLTVGRQIFVLEYLQIQTAWCYILSLSTVHRENSTIFWVMWTRFSVWQSMRLFDDRWIPIIYPMQQTHSLTSQRWIRRVRLQELLEVRAEQYWEKKDIFEIGPNWNDHPSDKHSWDDVWCKSSLLWHWFFQFLKHAKFTLLHHL